MNKDKEELKLIKDKKFYKIYIKSQDWRDKKSKYIDKYGSDCEICKKKGNSLHHRNYDRVGKEKDGDLLFLCMDCHKKIHISRNGNFFSLDKYTMSLKEERVRLYKSPEMQGERNKYKKKKIKEAKKDYQLHSNLGSKFIGRYGNNIYLDFLQIYKECKNVKEVFEIYGIDYDKDMALSFMGTLGFANQYGFDVSNLIEFCYKYQEFNED